MPRLMGGPPPFVRLFVGGSLPGPPPSQSTLSSVRLFPRWLSCLPLCCSWSCLFAYAGAHGCCATHGRFVAYCDTAPGCSAAPCVVSLGGRVACCSAACGAPLWPLLALLGAPPPVVRQLLLLLVGASLPLAVPLFVCSRAPCATLRGWCATSCSLCLGAPLLLTPELVLARVPLVGRPMGVLLPIAPRLLLAHLHCVPSVYDAVLPLAFRFIGLCPLLRLGLLALLRLWCGCSWMLCRLSLCRPRSLSYSVHRFPRLLGRRFLCCSWGSVVASCWACGHPSTLNVAALGRCAAVCSALPPSRCPAPCAMLCGCCAASCSSAHGGRLSRLPGFLNTPPPCV